LVRNLVRGHGRAAISAAVTSTGSPRRTAAGHLRASELLEDVFDPILGVTEEHLAVLLEEQGFYTAAYPGAMDRLKTTTSLACQTLITGIPATGLPG